MSTAPAPQSKPVAPASRLVAHVAPSVAFGLGRGFWPQGQLDSNLTPIERGAKLPGCASCAGELDETKDEEQVTEV
jgi:hypothetical protein